MAALAEQLTDDGDIARGISVFSERSLAQGARVWTPEEVGPSGRVRLYRARASEQFVLTLEDERLPLMLEEPRPWRAEAYPRLAARPNAEEVGLSGSRRMRSG
jgi:hypothetical protein